jgi:hypothetical protein
MPLISETYFHKMYTEISNLDGSDKYVCYVIVILSLLLTLLSFRIQVLQIKVQFYQDTRRRALEDTDIHVCGNETP